MSWGAAILDAQGLRLSAEEARFFREADPFGFILFARNIDTADQVRALCEEMRATVGRDAPILIDQEGGRVQRLRPPLARNWPAPLEFVEAAGENAVRAMYLRARLMAADMQVLGIDVNCAPMADVATPDTHPFLRNRCYASNAGDVAALARAVAEGLMDGGVLPVVKHMPGHGRAAQDSHHDLPRVQADAQTLRGSDFAAFRPLADLPMGMTAHVVYDDLDDRAATVSPRMVALIRDELGFDGLLMTDDISMQALSGTPAMRTRAALDAGCDVALFCNAPLSERRAVAEAAGRMTRVAQARAEAAVAARRAAGPLDAAAAWAEIEALTGGFCRVG